MFTLSKPSYEEKQLRLTHIRKKIERANRQRTENWRVAQRDLYTAFIDLIGAPRKVIWESLCNKGVPEDYIRSMRKKYRVTESKIKKRVVGMSRSF